MIISLKQLFPQFNPETEQISDPDFRNQSKINTLFQLLHEENATLRLKFKGSTSSFNSCIINIDQKNGTFTLDELHPINGHKMLLSTGNFIAHAIIKGVNISFHTSLLKTERNGQFYSYICDIPPSISYIQRRREYRVRIHPEHSVDITTQYENSPKILQGYVHDVSLKGIAIDFPDNLNIKPKPGDQLTNCKLTIPKNETINFTLEARHIQSTPSGKLRIGGHFRDLDTRSEEIICRFVREMERAALKK